MIGSNLYQTLFGHTGPPPISKFVVFLLSLCFWILLCEEIQQKQHWTISNETNVFVLVHIFICIEPLDIAELQGHVFVFI